MTWQFNSFEPVFIQLSRKIRAEIILGVYGKGEQIPSVRQLAADASVNPNTVQRALLLLEDEGLLCARGTAGRFITEDEALISRIREEMRADAVRALLKDTRGLGITKSELLRYIDLIEKEESDNE
jgi:DNA-binding transcriptional regulator YhcF (GntR family)